MPQYRGYKIELMHDGSGWQVTVHPMRPDLPILRQFSFRPEPFPEGAALEEAKRRVRSSACTLRKRGRNSLLELRSGHVVPELLHLRCALKFPPRGASRRRYFDGGTSTQLAWLNG